MIWVLGRQRSVGAGPLLVLLLWIRVGLLELVMMIIVDVGSCGSSNEKSSCLNDGGSAALSMWVSHITVVDGKRHL
jgi:hypothetical protein